MKHLTVYEYDKIPRGDLGRRLCRSLQTFDEAHDRVENEAVFDWSRRKFIRAKSWVGVLRIPGLEIEILPKTERLTDVKPEKEREGTARSNLLYMLSLTKNIPVRERDLANLATRRMRLFELLVRIFSQRLLDELKKGPHHTYVRREENLGFVKGKILMSEHIRLNVTNQERVFVAHDEFAFDTRINRIFKATCRHLYREARSFSTQRLLRQNLLLLDEVTDVEIVSSDFDKIVLDRNTDRFEEPLIFCELVLSGRSPAPRSGGSRTFSLLFPMERLFEEFVARFVVKYASDFNLQRDHICVQAARNRQWLLRRDNQEGQGEFRLKPDLLIKSSSNQYRIVLDTKWKRLLPDAPHQGVAQSDLYQLYAYAHRYETPDNVLLFPKAPGVEARTFVIDGEPNRRVRVEMVDVSGNIRQEKDRLVEDLKKVIPWHPDL